MEFHDRLREQNREQDFNTTKEGSLLDRFLVRKGKIEYDDLHQSLKDALLISGKITENDLESYFRSRLRLSGEIRFVDIEKEAQKLFALRGAITFEDLTKALQDKFIFANITEQQLSASLAEKINSSYHKDNILIDCGDFDDDLIDEVIDGGDW